MMLNQFLQLFLKGNSMTIEEIIECAYHEHNLVFSRADAQDVIDTKPLWASQHETASDAVADYLDAFGH